VVPVESLAEASLVEGLRIHGANTLTEVVAWLRGDDNALQRAPKPESPTRPITADLADVVGQPEARWALEVAAAGAHHLLLSGPPGTGKTMLAQRLSGLLPHLTTAEALEVTAIHSVSGLLSAESPLVTAPPFIALHHSASTAALVGGGTGLAKPGSASKAHRGVLFLDEACEFNRTGLDALRTAIEEGEVRLARQGGTVRYPARFQLVMATNTCPCAPPKEVDCTCTPRDRRRYMAKLSGPLLDRVDLRVKMRPLIAMSGAEAGIPEPTSVVRERVLKARTRATERWTTHNQSWRTNAEVPGPALRREFALPRQVTALLDRALSTGALTGRGADRCIRVAWTLADLAETDRPTAEHVAAALEFRERRSS
jgi:magnesium chelatase family protein